MANLGNVVGVVRSQNPPLEADGVTEKRYVIWAKPVGQNFEYRYFDNFLDSWELFDPKSVIDDSDNNPSLIKTFSKSKIELLLSGKLGADRIKDDLVSTTTDEALSANQGKVLKDFIDSILAILQSDDTTLDELQEVVTFIKANKQDLDNLGISNIAGLQDVLDSKLENETVTTINQTNDKSKFSYTDEDGNTTVVDLQLYQRLEVGTDLDFNVENDVQEVMSWFDNITLDDLLTFTPIEGGTAIYFKALTKDIKLGASITGLMPSDTTFIRDYTGFITTAGRLGVYANLVEAYLPNLKIGSLSFFQSATNIDLSKVNLDSLQSSIKFFDGVDFSGSTLFLPKYENLTQRLNNVQNVRLNLPLCHSFEGLNSNCTTKYLYLPSLVNLPTNASFGTCDNSTLIVLSPTFLNSNHNAIILAKSQGAIIKYIGGNDIEIRDSNNISQFTISDYLLVENLEIDSPNKKLIGQKVPFNLIIEGVQNEITNVTLLAQLFRNQGGGSITGSSISEYFSNFNVTGNGVTVTILQKVKLNGGFRPNQLGQNVTKIEDIQGFITEFGFQEFRGNTTIQEIILPSVTNGTQNVIEGCTSLVKCVIPNSSGGSINGCTSLTHLDIRNATNIGSLDNAPLTSFFKADNVKHISLNGFRGVGLSTVDLPNLLTISAQAITQNSNITTFKAPRLESMTSGSIFRFDTSIRELYFPNLIEINPNGNTAHMFDMASLELLYAPRCKVFGSDSVDNDFFRNRNLSNTVIVVNEELKTSNAGGINVNIQDAINLGANVIFANEFNTSFFNEKIDITNLYSDDTDAASGGIGIGETYVRTTGVLAVRLT